MSEEKRHKLYDYEVNPPVAAWDKIRAELDQSWSENAFVKKLGEAEVTPPATNWNKVLRALDEPDLQGQWVDRLQEMEVPPPVTAWNHIRLQLDENETAPLPKKSGLLLFFRYAAAAVVAGLLVLSGYWLALQNKKNTSSRDLAQVPSLATATDNSTPVLQQLIQTQQIDATSESLQEARNDAALEESKHTMAKLDVNRSVRQHNLTAFSFSAYSSAALQNRGLIPGNTDAVSPLNTGNTTAYDPNRYIEVMTPEGKLVRLSKKLGDFACCVSGDEQNPECDRQLMDLKTKLACEAGTHAPDNFMDLISLLNALKQK